MSRQKARIAVVASVALLLSVRELAVSRLEVAEYLLPSPTSVLTRLWETLPVQLEHLGYTVSTTLIGLTGALVLGVLLALLVTYVRPLRSILLPVFAAFNGIPKIAVAPLLVTWFGLGAEPKVLLAFLLSVFPVFVNATTGLSEIDPDILDLARLAGGKEWKIFWKIRLMNALPYLTDAVKVAFPLALVGALVGEFIGGNQGIGHLILSGQFNLDTPLVFACLLTLSLFTSAGIGSVSLFEKTFLGWRLSERRSG